MGDRILLRSKVMLKFFLLPSYYWHYLDTCPFFCFDRLRQKKVPLLFKLLTHSLMALQGTKLYCRIANATPRHAALSWQVTCQSGIPRFPASIDTLFSQQSRGLPRSQGLVGCPSRTCRILSRCTVYRVISGFSIRYFLLFRDVFGFFNKVALGWNEYQSR